MHTSLYPHFSSTTSYCADCGAPIAPAQIYRSHINTPRERTHCEACSRFKANAQAFVHVVQRRFAFEWGRTV